MTRAKHLHGAGKTEAVRGSFEKKLEHMQRVLNSWVKSGERDDQFWPKSLTHFREWESPSDGIYGWTSPSVTNRKGRYEELVARYWNLQAKAMRFASIGGRSAETKRLKNSIRVLAEQNAVLNWSIMELRDALVRVDPKNPALSKVKFP
ncbi:hypothetical protein [Ensifer aridi]|uniref:hypothetical protein n=1 Tax=Ensifer aridi TaxID=1708715 RepID=UPI000A0F41BF|nr:hypothetical protein [Ensifer aridi]